MAESPDTGCPIAEPEQILAGLEMPTPGNVAAEELYERLNTPDMLDYSGPPAESYGQILRERPEHKAIALLTAQGLSVSQIVGLTGYTSMQIYKVKAQPWFKTIVAKLQAAMGVSMLKHGLVEAAHKAVDYINKTITDPDAKEEVRARLAIYAIDQSLGSPIHRHEDITPPPPPEQKYEEFKRRLEMKRKEIEDLENGRVHARNASGAAAGGASTESGVREISERQRALDVPAPCEANCVSSSPSQISDNGGGK